MFTIFKSYIRKVGRDPQTALGFYILKSDIWFPLTNVTVQLFHPVNFINAKCIWCFLNRYIHIKTTRPLKQCLTNIHITFKKQ